MRNFDPWSLLNAGPHLAIELVISSSGKRLKAEAAPGNTSLRRGDIFYKLYAAIMGLTYPMLAVVNQSSDCEATPLSNSCSSSSSDHVWRVVMGLA